MSDVLRFDPDAVNRALDVEIAMREQPVEERDQYEALLDELERVRTEVQDLRLDNATLRSALAVACPGQAWFVSKVV